MPSCRGIVLAALLAVAGAACTHEHAAVVALRKALQVQYPGARFEVAFTHGFHNLELTVDSVGFRNYKLDSHQRHTIGEAMARFTLQHYGAAVSLDSITIRIIEERSGGLFWKSWSSDDETFAVAGLR
jgi:hypothetical protein